MPERPVWDQVDVRFISELPRLLPLEQLRCMPALKGMALFTRSRLSVQPVSPAEWEAIHATFRLVTRNNPGQLPSTCRRLGRLNVQASRSAEFSR